jgi:nitroreductase
MNVAAKPKREDPSPLFRYNEGMPWNAVEDIIFNRRSVRSFKKAPLPPGVIRRILEAGRFAPSAGNSQPWKFVVITSPQIIAEMERDAQDVAKVLMWIMDYTRSWFRRTFLVHLTKLLTRIFPKILHPVPLVAMMQMGRGKMSVFFDPPAVILLLKDVRGAADPGLGVGIAGQNMALAASSLGVGTCWIGFVRLLEWHPNWRRWKKRLGIAYPYAIAEALSVGWPAPKHYAPSPREILLVPWLEGEPDAEPRIERQGE